MITFGGPPAATLSTSVPGNNPADDRRSRAAQWTRVCDRLKQDVGDVEYRTWLRQMTLAGLDGDEVTVHLPTRFLRDWVRSHYGDKLGHALEGGEHRCVQRVDAPRRHGQRVQLPRPKPSAEPSPPTPSATPAPRSGRHRASPTSPARSTPASPSTRSSSASPTSSPMPAPAGSPNSPPARASTRSSSTAASASARPTSCTPSASNSPGGTAAPRRRLHVGREVHVPVHRGPPQRSPPWTSRRACAPSTF